MLTTSDGVLGSFQQQGFAVVDRLIDAAAVTELRAAYDELLRGDVKADGDRQLGGVTRQIMRPHAAHPAVRDTPARSAAAAIAAALLDCPAPRFEFDMMIYKPPGHPQPTPWHQDLAYYQQPFAPAGTPDPKSGVQFWLALDDVDPENGCMHFLPYDGPLLEHEVYAGDPADDSRLLAVTDPETRLDLDRVVACPLRAGDATVHGAGALHYTPPNRSADRPRRAYTMFFVDPDRHPDVG